MVQKYLLASDISMVTCMNPSVQTRDNDDNITTMTTNNNKWSKNLTKDRIAGGVFFTEGTNVM